LDPKLMFVCVS